MKQLLKRKREVLVRATWPHEGWPTQSDPDLRVQDVLPDDSSPWPISRALGILLAQLLSSSGRRNVLEFGAGSSSLVIARALQSANGGHLTSIEQSPEWCGDLWEKLLGYSDVDAVMIPARLRPTLCRLGVLAAFGSAAATVRARGPFDLVLIDAPQSYYGRDGALPLILESLAPGALIVLDDARRPMERWTLFRWLRSYPDSLRLLAFDPEFGGRGVAVLEFAGGPSRSFDMLSFLTGTWHTYHLWIRRRLRN